MTNTDITPTISVETHDDGERTIKTLDFKFDNCTIVFEISDRSFTDLKNTDRIAMNAKVEFIYWDRVITRTVRRACDLATNTHLEFKRDNNGRNGIYKQCIFSRIHKI